MRCKVLSNLNLHQPMRSYIASILQYLAIAVFTTVVAAAVLATIMRLCFHAVFHEI